MDRTIVTTFAVLIAITTVLASTAVIVFEPNGVLEGIPGIFQNHKSVWVLFAMPAVLAVVGFIGASGLTSTRIVYAPLEELAPDAQKGLGQHLRAERRLLIGTGVLIALVQLLVVLKTAGFPAPFELGARMIIFTLGMLFATAGNVLPKIPFFSRWWQFDRATYTHIIRFSGWAISIAGILICFVSVFVPIEDMRLSLRLVVLSMLGLFMVNALGHSLKTALRRRLQP